MHLKIKTSFWRIQKVAKALPQLHKPRIKLRSQVNKLCHCHSLWQGSDKITRSFPFPRQRLAPVVKPGRGLHESGSRVAAVL
ncbi:hypothetical protein Patl1_29050 [Pistacia atlantica]|uniref:Uncharacterized protein n=1 Tax=Pistacia atlantica TaxID=434234 RepID=A0ACC1BBQ3_9ROSI|nr:hypothetical protein Patl1_29050 [Pistacia atlantica]